jgi:hypothetical protein
MSIHIEINIDCDGWLTAGQECEMRAKHIQEEDNTAFPMDEGWVTISDGSLDDYSVQGEHYCGPCAKRLGVSEK